MSEGSVPGSGDDPVVDPPYLYPAYRSTILRAPARPLVTLPRSLTETTGTAAGRGTRRRARPRPHAPACGRAAGPADHRARPRARRRRAAGARTRWSRSGRPTPAAGTRTRATTTPRRSTRTSRGPGAPDRRRGPISVRDDQAGRLPVEEPRQRVAARRTSTSRCSGAPSPSAWSPRCTSRTIRCSRYDPIFNSIRDPTARERLIVALRPGRDRCPSGRWRYRWDIVLRGARRDAVGARRTTTRDVPRHAVADGRPVLRDRAARGPTAPYVVAEGTPGAIWIRGAVLDGDGRAGARRHGRDLAGRPDGRFDHPDDPRGARRRVPRLRPCRTDADGRYGILTIKPGRGARRRRRAAGAAHRRLGVRARPAEPRGHADLLRRRGGRERERPRPVARARRRPPVHADRRARPRTGTASTSVCRGTVRPSSSNSDRRDGRAVRRRARARRRARRGRAIARGCRRCSTSRRRSPAPRPAPG